MLIYKNYIRYTKSKNIHNIHATLFQIAINKIQANQLTFCQLIFLYEIYISIQIKHLQQLNLTHAFLQLSFQYLQKANWINKLQNWILMIQICRKNWLEASKYQLFQALMLNYKYDDKLLIITQKQYTFINKEINQLLCIYLKSALSNVEFRLQNKNYGRYELYGFDQIVKNVQDSEYLTQKHEFITQFIFKFHKEYKRYQIKIFMEKVLNQIIEHKVIDFIKYFKFYLEQRTTYQQKMIDILEEFCRLIVLYQQRWKIRIFSFQDFIKMDYLPKYFYTYVYQNHQNAYPYFEKFLLEYTILHTQIPLFIFIHSLYLHQTLQQLIAKKSVKIYSFYLKNMHQTSKFILNYYIDKSNLNLKRYPPQAIVDPLHFLMIKSKFWNNQYDCNLLTSALYINLESWLKIIQQKQIDSNKKRKYKTQLSLIILQFLLTVPKSEILEYFPIQNQLLSYLFTLPSFPTLAINCEYFFTIPWCHMLRAYLPDLIFYENGFKLANLIFQNWKGRICYEAAESIINSIISQLNNFQKKNKKGLKELLNNYKTFGNLNNAIKIIESALFLD